MRFVGVIPTRYQSSRLPGKALIELAGRPLIEWVYRQAQLSTRLDALVVATDDERIRSAVEQFGGNALLTRDDHASGTDRVAEVASRIPGDVFINIQGDEPLIAPETIDSVCQPFLVEPELEVSTACVLIDDAEQISNPHVCKVVFDHQGRALYFSRSVIPHPRREGGRHFKHVGIYGYRRAFLLRLNQLVPSCLEKAEALEQLRFLENGIPIRVVRVEQDSIGVDTPEDVEVVRRLLENSAGVPGKSIQVEE